MNATGPSTFSELLDDLGITLTEIARRSGVARSTLSGWANGKSAPRRRDSLAAVARQVGVSPSELRGLIERK